MFNHTRCRFVPASLFQLNPDLPDVQSQISKILEFPAPRAGDVIRLDASPANEAESLEVVCRFPGGLDFGRGLVDVNVRRL